MVKSEFVSRVRMHRVVLVVMGLWGLFSFTVHTTLNLLNRIKIPVLDFPLGFYLAAQGSLVVFVFLLFWFVKSRDGDGDVAADRP